MKKDTCGGACSYTDLIRKTILYMKISAIFLLLALQVSATNYAQERVNLKATNISVAEIFKAIENQSSYRFNYSNDILPTENMISVNLVKADINTVLNKIFEGAAVRWKIERKHNVFLIPVTVTDNTGVPPVTGVVRNETGEPIEGASVVLKNSTIGSTTGADGNFTINTKPGDVLIISRVGYTPQEITVTTEETIAITLVAVTGSLEEIVVVGYGTQKKENLTGAVSTVNAESLEGRPITNLGQGLQGLIPNLIITPNNGRPGTSAGFNIRGTTSINGGNPLILVDGVQMDPNQLDPNDVASVTVLKDAASAAIYGGRAAYGVILITTKKGKKNTPLKVDYSYYYAKTTPTRLPHLVSSLDYVTMYMEADATGRATGGNTGSTPFNATDIEKIKAYMANPIPGNAVYRDPANPRLWRYVGNTDWVSELYPSWAPQQQHNISVNGGTEKTSYRASFGAFNQDGVLKVSNQKYKRYNAAINLNTQATKWMDLNFNMTLNRKENDQPATTSYQNPFSAERFATDLRPIMPIYHPDGHYSGQGSFTNPFAIINSGGREQYQSDDIWLTGGFTIRPIKNVSVVGDYTWNSYHINNKTFIKEFNEYGAAPVGSDSTNPNNAYLLGKYPWNIPAIVSESNSHDYYLASNIYTQYENTFALKHYVKAMVGYNYEFKHNESFNARAKTLLNQDYPYLGLNNDIKPVVGGAALEKALLGAFFRLNYVFNRKYLLEINGRYDGSSRFNSATRYVFSPSFSAGWRISEESFFEPLKSVVNDLKFRASYGTLPNQYEGPTPSNNNYFPYIATMPYGITSYIFGSEQQAYVTAPNLVSSLFTWENVTSKNFGVDFALIRNRLTGSFDIYTRDTRNMLVAGFAAPAVLGVNPPTRNAADLRTKGFELQLDWKDRMDNGLVYNVGFNVADNTAKITKYDLNPTGNISDYYVGRAIGDIWGFETVGFYATDADAAKVDNSKIWSGTWLAGDIQYKNLNGDKTADGKDIISYGASTLADPGDRKIIANNQSRYQYGFNVGAEYKGFDFSLLGQGVMRKIVALGGTYFWGFTGQWDVPTTEQLNYWKPDNTNAYYPRVRFGGGNTQAQTKYLQNAAYLRLKQVTLGYTIPKTMTERVWIRNARVYFTGQNLFEFTKLIKSFDPEQLDRNSYPLNRSVAFGIQIGL